MSYLRDPYDTDEPPCFCDSPAGPEFCPAHGDPDKPLPLPRELGEDENGVIHHIRDPKGDEAAHG